MLNFLNKRFYGKPVQCSVQQGWVWCGNESSRQLFFLGFGVAKMGLCWCWRLTVIVDCRHVIVLAPTHMDSWWAPCLLLAISNFSMNQPPTHSSSSNNDDDNNHGLAARSMNQALSISNHPTKLKMRPRVSFLWDYVSCSYLIFFWKESQRKSLTNEFELPRCDSFTDHAMTPGHGNGNHT